MPYFNGAAGSARKQALAVSRSTHTSAITNNHGLVIVRYVVDYTDYEQPFAPHNGSVGDSVVVYYKPNDPKVSAIDDPLALLRNRLLVSGIASVLFSTLFALALQFPGFAALWSWPWRLVPFTPRVVMRVVGVVSLIAGGLSVYRGTVDAKLLISEGLIFSGIILLLVRSFQAAREAGWLAFVRSRLFITGLCFVLAGQVSRLL